MTEPFTGFEVGQKYRLHEQMWPASKAFGTYNAGIALAGRYPATVGIVVLARLGERTRYGDAPRYGNRLDADVLVFSGEDRRGYANARHIDQVPFAGANRAITESTERGTPIYCFCAREEDESWDYLGVGRLGSWSLVPRDRRLVVEFRIDLLGLPSEAAAKGERLLAEEEILSKRPPELTVGGDRKLKATNRKLRSAVFSTLVRKAYSNKCAICGVERRDRSGHAEVEAAHIYPVELDGADDIRNGLALCRLHHWAFDRAILGVGTDLGVQLLQRDNHGPGIADYDGRRLAVVPGDDDAIPHSLYLGERLKLSRRGWTRGKKPDED